MASIETIKDEFWSDAIDRFQPVELLPAWQPSKTARPQVVSARFRPRKPRVKSFWFAPTETGKPADSSSKKANKLFDPYADLVVPGDKESGATDESTNASSKKPCTRTRLKPPSDVIKLEDRLFYLLQPPLENLLADRTMEFPFEPFTFQYAGIAFLFPRHNAILADEMGLGKTMQAISTVRMLLRAGYIRDVLLICPKPLVTNWQREFKTWAPEVTVSVIKGNQHQRRWHWKADTTMVKVANYELLTRDEEFVIDPDRKYDLVILDEAQRIKNKGNSTSQVVQRIPRRRSWALTGTPIENGIEDLVGICEFAAKGSVTSGMTPREVRTNVKDLILRRTKDLVMKDMPPRLMRDAEIPLSPEQQITYDGAENDGVMRLNDLGDKLDIKHVFELVLLSLIHI